MRDSLLIQQLREAIQEFAALPDEEQDRELIRRGVIDERGNVLVRVPEPPAAPKKKKPKKKRP